MQARRVTRSAIQANDLVGRKTLRDGGRTAKAIAAQIAATETELERLGSTESLAMLRRLRPARLAFEEVVDYVLENAKAHVNAVFAGSVNYLMLAATTVAGWQLARALIVAQTATEDAAYCAAKIATARFC